MKLMHETHFLRIEQTSNLPPEQAAVTRLRQKEFR